MGLPYGPLHYWVVTYHYRPDDEQYVKHGTLRLVATDIEQAISLVKQKPLPNLTIFTVAHHGKVDVVCPEAAKAAGGDDG